jgi:hypothetical protein
VCREFVLLPRLAVRSHDELAAGNPQPAEGRGSRAAEESSRAVSRGKRGDENACVHRPAGAAGWCWRCRGGRRRRRAIRLLLGTRHWINSLEEMRPASGRRRMIHPDWTDSATGDGIRTIQSSRWCRSLPWSQVQTEPASHLVVIEVEGRIFGGSDWPDQVRVEVIGMQDVEGSFYTD